LDSDQIKENILSNSNGAKINSKVFHRTRFWSAVFGIRIGFNADPDPTFLVNADPDADPDPGFC
jgi:hypothetical protein